MPRPTTHMLVEAIGLLLAKNCGLCQHCLWLVVTGWWLESVLVQQIIVFLVQFQFSLDFKISIGPIYFLIMLPWAKIVNKLRIFLIRCNQQFRVKMDL